MKPIMKCEVVVSEALKNQRFIYFYGTPDSITEIEKFGDVLFKDKRQKHLHVDPRYDFDEVLAWLNAYGT